jgi:beta-phosphoglucomutase
MLSSPPIADGVALIFDLDGVIVDSMPLHSESWRLYLERQGVACDDLDARMHGRRNDEIVREFIGRDLPPEQVFAHGAAKERLFREMMGARLREYLVPGVEAFLESRNGARTGLASNAEPPNIDFVLDGAGLRRYFDVVVDGHQVQRPKPFPDVYLRAAQLLGVSPDNCVVFEDSPTGIAAAKAAGTRVVGVQTYPAPLPEVDLVIRDFRDPALEPWLAGLRAKI